MKVPLLLKIIIIMQSVTVAWTSGGKKSIEVTQPSFTKAFSGESAIFTCSFATPVSPSFTVKWTLCCGGNSTPLQHHGSYKDRVFLSPSFKEIMIVNLTEPDMDKYCCHVQTADGKEGTGNGTFLEVLQYIEYSAGSADDHFFSEKICLLMEISRLVLLSSIIILLSVLIKKLT